MNDENDFLSRGNMRSLGAYILDQIAVGDVDQNIAAVGYFITSMVTGLMFGGAKDVDHAIEGLDALYSDVRKLLEENFDAAKEAIRTKSN